MWCDYKNLEYFQTSKVLSRSQARWLETVSAYDFVIKHWEGSKNLADVTSKRPNYKPGYEGPVGQLVATVSVEPHINLMPQIITAPASDHLAIDISAKHDDQSMIDATETPKEESQWKVVVGVMTYDGRIDVPATNSLRGNVISLFHNNPQHGHF
jgi:hypothetical protein